ncbi:50S ribosomal protein L15 [Candidatus Nomurabacteria bacterium]|nr:50S ribosomal protein L15 [Candidatus Nomurabacteria bacterium]
MMLNNLKRTTENKKAKLVGRGGTRGKTSGRGTKGQKARAGHKIRPHIRDIIKKYPKLRGRGKNINKAFAVRPAVVNLDLLEKRFNAGESVTPATLLAKKLITRNNGVIPAVKILDTGTLTKSLEIFDCQASDSAKTKIEKAGGKVNG